MDYYERCKKYMDYNLDFKGGGCISCNKLDLYQVCSCYRESKFKIFKVNVVLFFMWLFRPRKRKKLKDKTKMALASIIIIGIILSFYVSILFYVFYRILLLTGG